MSLFSPTSPARLDAVDAAWLNQPVAFLLIAAVCLVVALRFLKRAVAPADTLVRAVAAAAVVAFATSVALAMVIAAAVTSVR